MNTIYTYSFILIAVVLNRLSTIFSSHYWNDNCSSYLLTGHIDMEAIYSPVATIVALAVMPQKEVNNITASGNV